MLGKRGTRSRAAGFRLSLAVTVLALMLAACGSQPAAQPKPAEQKAAAPALAAPAVAEKKAEPAKPTYPTRPIRLIITHSAGGSTDVVGRLAATQPVEKHLGQPLVPENLTGAGGNIARATIFKAPPDGYALLVSQMPSMDSGEIVSGEYESMKFTHVFNLSGRDYNVVAVPGTSSIKSIKDLVDAAKKKELTNSGSGIGANSWLIAMMLKDEVGVNLRYVPFNSGKEAAMAVAGGQVDMGTGAVESFMPLHQQGRVRIIGTFGPVRQQETKDFPTLVELGYPKVKLDQLTGIFAPPGTPKAIVDTLAAAFDKAFKDKDFQDAAAKAKVNLLPLAPQEFLKEHKDINDVIQGMKAMIKANVK